MSKQTGKRSRKAGLPPGPLMYLGDQPVTAPTMTLIDYNEEQVHERRIENPEDGRPSPDRSSVRWINVDGLSDVDVLQKIGHVFSLHPLMLEDIATLGQRPKLEDDGDCLFMTLRMLYRRKPAGDFIAEQVSIVLGNHYVLTFQEQEGDVFDAIRERIRTGKGRIRKMGAAYLAYALLDAIVDNYFVVLEDLDERIEQIQDAVLDASTSTTLRSLHVMKRELIFLRKSVWPLRELVSEFRESESPLIGEALGPYLRDVYEHTVQIMDTVESLRDLLNGALDVYVSTVGNRLNEIIKVLTMIATIFIPLTFLAGVYGMNFKVMPELEWRYGYFVILGLMVAVAIVMVFFFKRRRWL